MLCDEAFTSPAEHPARLSLSFNVRMVCVVCSLLSNMVRSTLPREIVVAKLFRWSSDSSDISKMGHSIQDELLKVDGFEER